MCNGDVWTNDSCTWVKWNKDDAYSVGRTAPTLAANVMESLLLNGICVNMIGIYCFWSYVQLRNGILLISSIHYVTKLNGQTQSVLSGDRWDSREGKHEFRMVRTNCFISASRLRMQMIRRFGRRVSVRTIRRRLLAAGYLLVSVSSQMS